MYVLEDTDWSVYFPVGTEYDMGSDFCTSYLNTDYNNHLWDERTYRMSNCEDYDQVEEVLKGLSEFFCGKPLDSIPGLSVYITHTYDSCAEDVHMVQLVLEDGEWKYTHHVTKGVLADDKDNPYDMSIVS